MTALYIILAVVAVIMLLLLIPADCILEFSYNNKENNGSVIIKYVFLKFKIFPNDKVEEEVENEEETTDKEEKKDPAEYPAGFSYSWNCASGHADYKNK